MSPIGRIGIALSFLVLLTGNLFSQQFFYENTPVLEVVKDIETNTDYRFLYREALLSGIKVSFNADESSLFERFSSALIRNKLGLKVDSQRNQALIYRSTEDIIQTNIQISGYVVDAKTGERLPFAALSWRDNGIFAGTTTNANGQFNISIASGSSELPILITYVGYDSEQIQFSFTETSIWQDVSIRLTPKPYSGKEILVQGINFYTPNDTVLNGLMKIGSFSPLGESNAVRSLQMLPAVSMSAAVNDGINIRGSSSDGFQVLLDGQTMYGQSHLFGLLDAMNADALKSSGFYYDITPAHFQAPLGGTLSLITRTGSLNDYNASIGISNTAVFSTLEGPIKKGTSSWLISGRISYIDELDWFNNAKMIEYGLDVSRPVGFVDPRLNTVLIRNVDLNTIDVQNTDASFYDIHGKLYFETKKGTQFIVSGYLGKDEASQTYLRDENDFVSINTSSNFWENNSATVQYNTTIGALTFSESRLGYTAYNSQYYKDDFEFPVVSSQNGLTRIDSVTIQPLDLENEVLQFDLDQSFTTRFNKGTLNYGFSYSDFDVRYQEIGQVRQSFLSRRTSQLFDVYQQLDIELSGAGNLSIGNRLHYFSNGKYMRWSPRLKSSFHLTEALTFGIGFSRNYQFINRLEFYNINSNDFWILTNEEQPPSAVNYITSGIYHNINPWLYLQAEVYNKKYENLRLHELTTNLVSVSFRNNGVPWFYENDGRSRGIELLMKNRFSNISLTTGYTYSITELRNDRINNGNYFYADWDRRHQLSSAFELNLKKGFTVSTSWTYGSGTPSRIDLVNIERTLGDRLPFYSRFDINFKYKSILRTGDFETSFSLYNMLNRNNPWYSEFKQVSVTTLRDVRQGSVLTHVYDLGVQPSFNVKFNF